MKIQPYDQTHAYLPIRGANLSGIGTIAHLANSLAAAIERPVVDRTGLQGRYVYAIRYAPLSSAADTDRPDIFSAVEEQLGLKLVARKQPMQILVIDKGERIPSEN